MKLGLWVLAALALGVALGAWVDASGLAGLRALAEGVSVVGSVWLDALRMTLVPLIFAILVASIAQIAETAAVGTLARRTLALMAALVLGAGVYGIAATNAALAAFPVAPEVGEGLLSGAKADEAPDAPLSLTSWLRSLIPANVVKAAAENAVLPLVVFACLFGVAVTRLAPELRAPVVTFFRASGEAMILIVGWILALAPVGVFGLSLSLGLETGFSAIGVLAHYVAVVSGVTIGIIAIAFLIGLFGAGLPPAAFVRAVAPVQVIAASTQSSLASLPAMLSAAMGPMGVAPKVAEFVLPLAVAVFRITSPVANLAVAAFVAHLHGLEPSLAQWAAALLVAFAVSVSTIGLPGQASFFASVAPICVALGVPVTVLPILLAVEVIPDVFRTVGNVTADLSVTGLLNRWQKRRDQRGA
jgi:proton glutamate symport protein